MQDNNQPQDGAFVQEQGEFLRDRRELSRDWTRASRASSGSSYGMQASPGDFLESGNRLTRSQASVSRLSEAWSYNAQAQPASDLFGNLGQQPVAGELETSPVSEEGWSGAQAESGREQTMYPGGVRDRIDPPGYGSAQHLDAGSAAHRTYGSVDDVIANYGLQQSTDPGLRNQAYR